MYLGVRGRGGEGDPSEYEVPGIQSALFPRQLNLFDISAAITPQRWRATSIPRALNRIREKQNVALCESLTNNVVIDVDSYIGGESRTLRFTFLSLSPSSLPSPSPLLRSFSILG